MVTAVKLGGYTTSTPAMLEPALAMIARRPDELSLIALSAPKGTTDNLKRAVGLVQLARRQASHEERKILEEEADTLLRGVVERYRHHVDHYRLPQQHLRDIRSDLRLRLLEYEGEPAYHRPNVEGRGEEHMGTLLTAILRQRGLTAHHVPVEGMLVSEEPSEGRYEPEADRSIAASARLPGIKVFDGYSGRMRDGRINTVGRDGTNYTLAKVAVAAGAATALNLSNTPGVYRADPDLVRSPDLADHITYAEKRELGFRIFRNDAITILSRAGIELRITDSMRPEEPGTLLSPRRDWQDAPLAGMSVTMPYSVVRAAKVGMDEMVGVGAVFFSALANSRLSFTAAPTQRDVLYALTPRSEFTAENERALMDEIGETIVPDEQRILHAGLCLVNIVGEGLPERDDVLCDALAALRDAGIKRRIVGEPPDAISFAIAVHKDDTARAGQAIYDAVFRRRR